MLSLVRIGCVAFSLVVFGLAASGSGAAESGKEKAKAFETLIFDRAAFVKYLPKKTLVVGDPKDPKISPQMAKMLAGLGPVPEVEFVPLLAGMTPPKILQRVPPRFAASGRDPGRLSEAMFLILVNEKGEVGALYCQANTDRPYAIAAAAALIKWRFEPAKLGDMKLPVLMSLPMEFRSR